VSVRLAVCRSAFLVAIGLQCRECAVDQFDSALFSNKSFNEVKGKGIRVYDNRRPPAIVFDATD